MISEEKKAYNRKYYLENKPRGLLCTRCNTGLGQFLDNPLLLLRAIEYLAKYALKQGAHA